TEMLLGTLGSCTGINVVLLLKKYKQPLRSLEVEVEGEREEEWPKAFTKIRITFRCAWDGKTDKEMVERAIDLACNRYCPIHAAPQEAGALRVGHHPGHPGGAAPVGSLLPDGDALHHLRRRGGLLLSVGRPPAPAEVVWPDRDAGLHRHPGHRPRPHLAQGRP